MVKIFLEVGLTLGFIMAFAAAVFSLRLKLTRNRRKRDTLQVGEIMLLLGLAAVEIFWIVIWVNILLGSRT